MNTKHKYTNRLMAFLIKLSVCLFLFLVSFSSESICQENERSQNLRRQVRDIYTSQIGVREQGTNSGPHVLQYLNYVNLPKGNPWCAAFVCWALGKANVPNPRTGWSPDLFRAGKVIWSRAESGKVKVESRAAVSEIKLPTIQAGNPKLIQVPLAFIYPTRQTTDNGQPGTADVFGIYFPDKKRIAHVGFVDLWDGTWLITVEGNTTISGSREGDGVYRKRRPVQSIYQVARYIAQP